MIVRGIITHLHVTPLATKRGSTTLTAVRVIDDHSRAQHGGQPGSRPSPTRYEIQFVDSKLFQWSAAIQTAFSNGDEILAYADDEIRVRTADDGAVTLIVHGIDLGHSSQSAAKRQD